MTTTRLFKAVLNKLIIFCIVLMLDNAAWNRFHSNSLTLGHYKPLKVSFVASTAKLFIIIVSPNISQTMLKFVQIIPEIWTVLRKICLSKMKLSGNSVVSWVQIYRLSSRSLELYYWMDLHVSTLGAGSH